MIRNMAVVLVAAWMVVSASPMLRASEIKIIANAGMKIDTISAAQLRRVFLQENAAPVEGATLEPVLEKDGPVHQAFLQEYMRMSEEDLSSYYHTLFATGKGSVPKIFGSDTEVVAYVARTRGAIGYVGSTSNSAGVKTLSVGVPDASDDRKLLVRVAPDYPDTLRRLNIGGTVRLRVSIAPSGKVDAVELMGGNPVLGESAISAVKKWQYATGRSATVTELTISFGLR